MLLHNLDKKYTCNGDKNGQSPHILWARSLVCNLIRVLFLCYHIHNKCERTDDNIHWPKKIVKIYREIGYTNNLLLSTEVGA